VSNGSIPEKQLLKLKTSELMSRTAELDETNRDLARANQELELKTTQFNEANKALFESNRELAEVNKELAETNKRFALTNKQFAEINSEFTAVTKELASAYQTIEQQNKTHSEFISIAAHELRTPAHAILGYAELAKIDPILYKEDKGGFIDAIYRNAFRLNKLIQDILDVSRIESNTLTLNKELFKLADVIFTCIQDVKDEVMIYKERRILLQPSKANNNIFILADKRRINQVISNLLTNAIKFTAEDDTITIMISTTTKREEKDNNQQKEEVIVSIKDTGIGIAPEIFPRLFIKFVTKSEYGTGLGLYISKSIIEAHGGRIWAENNAISGGERGATFSFSLPLAAR
jgi:signal transduction histidine kinase